jgi:hypothetical protein
VKASNPTIGLDHDEYVGSLWNYSSFTSSLLLIFGPRPGGRMPGPVALIVGTVLSSLAPAGFRPRHVVERTDRRKVSAALVRCSPPTPPVLTSVPHQHHGPPPALAAAIAQLETWRKGPSTIHYGVRPLRNTNKVD